MAVYTKINKRDISYINTKFNNEKFISFKGIKQGIENTNYLLKSENKKFILTIFEKRVSKKEIPFFMILIFSFLEVTSPLECNIKIGACIICNLLRIILAILKNSARAFIGYLSYP